jgi:hypothetical protein
MPSDPLVVEAPAAGAAADGVVAVGTPVLAASPTPPIALPVTVMGTWMPRIAWVPPSSESTPEVVDGAEDGAGVGADAGAGVAAVDGWPTSEMALPATVTGADAPMTAWVPERTPSLPLVSAALAAAAPRRVNPPTRRVPKRALETILFMVEVLLI